MACELRKTRSVFDINLRTGTTMFALVFVIAMLVAAIPTWAQTIAVLHSFTGEGDGGEPQAGLTMDRSGNFYGTTSDGGVGYGTVFKLSRAGTGWTLSTLYTFRDGNDGGRPISPVAVGPDGSLYGTTTGGGAAGAGTVFNLRPPASFCRSIQCPWNETVIHSFTGGDDGRAPQYGGLIFDSAGNIYGTAGGGGSGCSPGCGLVFKLTKTGGSWAESVLYAFTGFPDGAYPTSGVIFDSAGNLYGTTSSGGSADTGTVYELSNTGSVWTETILHSLNGGSDGGGPIGGVVFDQVGNLYGTASAGGARNAGTVYQLQPSGGTWTFNTIYAFNGVGEPFDTPVLDASGNLYATSSEGGANGGGNVFKLTNGTHGWTYIDLYDFNLDLNDGYSPLGGVVLDSAGNVYGTTALGGIQGQNCGDGGCGVIFEITP